MASESTVLVTGAGGFIGGRVVEILYGTGRFNVRAAVRRWSTAARIGRLPIDLVQCDILSEQDLVTAMADVDYVVHCAVGPREVTVDGTRNVLAAAMNAGCKRVVHLSTVDVYGTVTGSVDETSTLDGAGKAYGEMKIEAEKVCQTFSDRGAPVVVLRPTIVYGPFSESWTVEFVQRMQSGPWFLPQADCAGTCNLVYVDDLVTCVVRCLESEAAVGQIFNVNGPERPTWHEYFVALNRAIGLPELRPVNPATSKLTASIMLPVRKTAKLALAGFSGPIMALYKRYDLMKRLMRGAEHAIKQTPTPAEFELYGRVVDFDATKIADVLGFEPTVRMEAGVNLAALWLGHHQMLTATQQPVATNDGS